MHATRSVLPRTSEPAPRAACTIRVAVWSAYPVVAEALRDCLRRGPAGLDAERLADDAPSAARFDVGLVLHDDIGADAATRLMRAGVPVLQLTDEAVGDRLGVRVLPRRSALPAIVRAIERLAHPAASVMPRSTLSTRELEVATLYAEGRTIAAVAHELEIGLESVRTYLRRARTKLRDDGYDASSQVRLAELHALGRLRERAPRPPVAAS